MDGLQLTDFKEHTSTNGTHCMMYLCSLYSFSCCI